MERFAQVRDFSVRLDDDLQVEVVWKLFSYCFIIDSVVLLIIGIKCLWKGKHVRAATNLHHLNQLESDCSLFLRHQVSNFDH